jgi:hypothetical protein
VVLPFPTQVSPGESMQFRADQRPKFVEGGSQSDRIAEPSEYLLAKEHRHFGDAELARGLQTQVSVDDFTVAAGKHRDFEAELADAAAHAIDGGIVLAGVPGVEDELVDWPQLNALP